MLRLASTENSSRPITIKETSFTGQHRCGICIKAASLGCELRHRAVYDLF